ncbi:hypothetical protein GCM10009641_81600 [Mycobacterium cookii]|uniref:HTH tetR-type domain-containing protein n=1 Tax=Nocardioides furvisabuli TaxID=375542 RepID=A0ABN2WW37_9ACTN|nr:TetR/AcrR family transcriptional regulator [Nocardioides furvisabuli]
MTRERLVAAGYETFIKSGYSATAIRDITDAADVNRATFYLHFAGKSELFLAVIEHQLARSAFAHWDTLDAALTSGSRASIRAWLEDAARWWLDNAAFVSAWNEAVAVDATLRASPRGVYDRIGRSLAQFESSLPEGPERQRGVLRVEMLVMLLNSVLTQYLQPETPQAERAGALDALTEIWCATLRVPEGSAE